MITSQLENSRPELLFGSGVYQIAILRRARDLLPYLWQQSRADRAIGIVVQLAVLGILTSVFRLGYLPATALAVEAAVLHNFLWHERFTWSDRARVTRRQALGRLLRFNLTTGAVSILGNLPLMRALVGLAHLPRSRPTW